MNLSLTELRGAYAENKVTPREVMAIISERCEQYHDHNIWIHQLTAAELEPYLQRLESSSADALPLYGIPFAIKDNIDLAGVPTTAACEAFAYTPERSAFVVQRLIDAGAIPVGKTNLDQFATGLVGTRSPWGACKNSFDPSMISGGSSAGSAVSVALGMASFSLGTDTAGSGRVPACFNNLVGVKPSIGLLSASGMLPACRSLDCITIFALQCDDANAILAIAEGEDASDAYSRTNSFANSARHYGQWQGPLRMGVLPAEQLSFFGHEDYAQCYRQSLTTIAESGVELVAVDFAPFIEAARLLYEGPWVAERYIATSPLIQKRPEALLDVTRTIISAGDKGSAVDAFTAQYRLKALRKAAAKVLESVDCLLSPTAGRPYAIDEVNNDPITLNSNLGYYTNYMNLFDLAGVAVPTGFTESGFPFGLTLVGEAFTDRRLLSVANYLQQLFKLPLGKDQSAYQALSTAPIKNQQRIAVAVCGAHLQGQPLNWQLTERGGYLLSKTQSSADYKLYALAGGPPFRPGMVIAPEGEGCAIELEVWSVPASEFGSFVAGIPAPLGIGKVNLQDGSQVSGFICEASGLAGAEDISHFGGWRGYLSNK
ncbi:allophanate hydrolase [Zhongshania aliphaticivorans]|uniref:allophanate hydrolase n=1 Tax=Zhongshania aliphaticivorans TaxID=1470434 RepID=UPI0012E4439D|nr:allophanate hydrolase [Zhongshania aliphaticivorans]CAA0100936.1 Allophanate hydrolase [Zhongshania aliphaticivorans]